MKKTILGRILSYINNVGVFRAIGLLTHRWLGKCLNPVTNYVWGSLGEDSLLYFILTGQLGRRSRGYYVDVGCNDPIYHSNTWRFYQLGWSGLAIDGNKELIDKYHRIRPRDIAVHALVSDRVEECDFFINRNDPAKSFLGLSIVAEHNANPAVLKVRMQTVTLNQILIDNKAPKEFDLLKVDVEGHDYQVIKSIDLETYRPTIIIVESHEYGIDNFIKTPMYVYLQCAGYYLHSLAGYNAIFLRR